MLWKGKGTATAKLLAMGLELPRIAIPQIRLPSIDVSDEIKRARFAVDVAQSQARQVIAARRPVELRAPSRPAALPTTPRSLKVASYNIYLGGKDYAGIEKAITGLKPDVVCIQEASRDAALKLGERLGMYSAFVENGSSSKAILSRYPFSPGSARNDNFRDSVKDRFEAAMKAGETEPAIQRSALSVSIDVGGRPVDIVDTHLSLFNPSANAEQLRELDAMMKAREAKGHTVVLAGDFNTNFALAKSGSADRGDHFETPTDTVGEWTRRYNADGKSPIGNIAVPEVRAAAAKLLAGRKSFWDAEQRVMQFGDRSVDATDAARQLRHGAPPAARAQLQQAVDGISHPGARKRFDNVIVSRDVKLKQSVIDASSTASDHRPVMTQLSW